MLWKNARPVPIKAGKAWHVASQRDRGNKSRKVQEQQSFRACFIARFTVSVERYAMQSEPIRSHRQRSSKQRLLVWKTF